MLLKIIFTLFLVSQSIFNVKSENILGVFITHSPSHLLIHMSVVNALIERGHNVTIITSLPLKDKNPKYHHVFLKNIEVDEKFLANLIGQFQGQSHIVEKMIGMFIGMKTMMNKFSEMFHDPTYKHFMQQDNQYDLMLLGHLFNDYQNGIAYHFKCPIVSIFVNEPTEAINQIIGNPSEVTHVMLAMILSGMKNDFIGRLLNVLMVTVSRIIIVILDLWNKSVYELNFPATFPNYYEAKHNVSLFMVNYHFSEGNVRALVPGLIEISGIQIKDKVSPLPKDIETFFHGANESGIIYFSLGTNLRNDYLQPGTLEKIYNVFSKLPQRVLWKYDTDIDPFGNASNILFKKWLPQDDILADKKIRLFVTHGGKGGITESIYNSIPMLVLPIYGDQPANAHQVVKNGYGISIENHAMMSEYDFYNAILEVLNNPIYKNKVENFSKIYRDRPMTPRQTAIYWIEYVMRHNGADHMQSLYKNMNYIEKTNLDVYLFLILISFIIFKIMKYVINAIFCKILHRNISKNSNKLKAS